MRVRVQGLGLGRCVFSNAHSAGVSVVSWIQDSEGLFIAETDHRYLYLPFSLIYLSTQTRNPRTPESPDADKPHRFGKAHDMEKAEEEDFLESGDEGLGFGIWGLGFRV